MCIKEMRHKLGDTQSEFATRYNIPFRTIQNWESGVRKPPKYILEMLQQRIENDLINRKTVILPKYDANKKNLPKRNDFIGPTAWLKAIRSCLGDNIVFALDEALMCHGNFGGRSDEYLVYIYGDDSAADYNGVVILGNYISDYCVKKRNGLKYTDFSRTVNDALANESILDMQGITEALSRYYYSHNESLEGVSVAPQFQKQFERLSEEVIDYYGV